MPTPAEVVERVFTTANPETGSLPPPDMAWAVFEGGTVFFAAPGDGLDVSASLDDVEAAARAAAPARWLREVVSPETNA